MTVRFCAVFYRGYRYAGRVIPVFSTAEVAFSDARNDLSRSRVRELIRQAASDAELRKYPSLQVDGGSALNPDGPGSKQGLFEGVHRADVRTGSARTDTNSQRDSGESTYEPPTILPSANSSSSPALDMMTTSAGKPRCTILGAS